MKGAFVKCCNNIAQCSGIKGFNQAEEEEELQITDSKTMPKIWEKAENAISPCLAIWSPQDGPGSLGAGSLVICLRDHLWKLLCSSRTPAAALSVRQGGGG